MKTLTGVCFVLMLLIGTGCSSGSSTQLAASPSPASATVPPTLRPSPSATAQPTIAPLPSPTPGATAIPSYKAGVGRIVSSAPASISLDELFAGQDAVWYFTEESGRVAQADLVHGEEVTTTEVGNATSAPYGNPKDMAVAGQIVWATDAGHHAVVKIDPTTNQVVDRIVLDKAAGAASAVTPFGLALDGTTLWVSDFDQGLVVKVDTTNKRVLATIDNVSNPEGMAVSPGAVWVVQHRSNSIVRIDSATNKIVATIDIPAAGGGGGVCGMCIDSVVASQDALWVPLDRGNGVARIDLKTNQIVATIPLKMNIRSVAVGDKAIWAAGSLLDQSGCNHDVSGALARIDPATNTEVGRLPIDCAMSVTATRSDVWVGTVADSTDKLYRIKPDP